MKNYLNIVYLCCLISGLFLSCQPLHEELPVNDPLAVVEEEVMVSETTDINARKGHRNEFGAFLTGLEEVPSVEASGSGAAFFELVDGGDAIKYEIRVANTDNIRAAHIHLGRIGQIGGVAVNLNPSGSSGIIAEGKFDAGDLVGPLINADLEDLLQAMREGGTYVNVHTTTHPTGELRGQISVVQPNENGNHNIKLTGDQEVPSVMTKAKGVGIFKFNSDNSALDFQINVSNIKNIRFSHIHIGKTGVNGPVVVTLRGDKASGSVNGVYARDIVMNEDLTGLMLGGDLMILREAIRTGNAYVNIHTDDFPGGELRGQF